MSILGSLQLYFRYGPIQGGETGISLCMSGSRVSQAIAARLGSRADREKASFIQRGLPVHTAIKVLNHSSPKLGDLVEVVGATCSGKTQLLHFVAADALSKSNNIGKPAVCWFDLNGGLCLRRLKQMIAQQKHKLGDTDECRVLAGLRIYHPESMLALCSSLHALPRFLDSPDGENGLWSMLRNVIIDALGTFHYLDKFQISTSDAKEKAPGSGTNEFVLVNVLRELLKSQKVIVFASKSALFEEEALGVKWPFSEAGIPSIPREFMPSSWRSISLHTVLLYFTADGRSAEAHGRSDQRRGIVSLLRNEDNSFTREMMVMAASTISIERDGILENENDIHVAA